MQNSLNKERNIVEFTSPTKVATDVIKGSTISPMSKIIEPKTAQIKPLKLNCIYVVKKDGTKEEFDNNKIINAVKKSATRMLVEFTDVELKEICDFVDENIVRMNKQEVTIADMHNLVEGALEHISPKVAQSYRNYRNYKQDFVHMLDKVYQESQRIMYIGDKENANADSTLVSTKRSLIFNELNNVLILDGNTILVNTWRLVAPKVRAILMLSGLVARKPASISSTVTMREMASAMKMMASVPAPTTMMITGPSAILGRLLSTTR